jgi:menaquinone-specific isochorismate synthase
MTVTPYSPLVLGCYENLHDFLVSCFAVSVRDRHTKIASFSYEIKTIDPLLLLQQNLQPQPVHFYFENPQKQEAIATLGHALQFITNGASRFQEAQQFLDRYAAHTMVMKERSHPFAGPMFLCAFTFFDQLRQLQNPFPQSILFLPKWQVIRCGDSSYLTGNVLVHNGLDVEQLARKVWGQLQQLESLLATSTEMPDRASGRRSPVWRAETLDMQSLNMQTFRDAVQAATQAIQQCQIQKVVLAHVVEVTNTRPFCLTDCLRNLRHMHPDCSIFSVGNGEGHSFIGASPEQLLSVTGRALVVDALAGSAPRGRSYDEDGMLAQQLLCSEKERHEHQVVVDFIAQRLRDLGLHPELTTVPTLRRLSNIQHLHTPIRAVVPPHLPALEILAALHPTPAVAGMPGDIAYETIRQYETFERSLYAAPIGWIDYRGNSEFVVGIRSALLDGHRAHLYAGAGIVAGSDPDLEVAEVKLKLKALLHALV